LIDGRQFSDVIDVVTRRGANIDSDHMLVVIKLRARTGREEIIQRVATNTIGYTKKQANKEWFDEQCAKVNEKMNAARERAIQIKTRGAKNAYKLAWTIERGFLQKKCKAARRRSFNRD
jgi:hypothetical protein